MSIKSDVTELESIKNELKRLNLQRKELLKKCKTVEKRIFDYLKAKDQPGLKHQGTAILLEQKEVRPAKKKKDINTCAITILEKYGIKNPEKALNEIIESRKSDPVKKEKLTIKKY